MKPTEIRDGRVSVPVVVAALLALIGSLAACSGKSDNSSTQSAAVDSPLGLDDATSAVMQTRVEELVNTCMKKAGFAIGADLAKMPHILVAGTTPPSLLIASP